MHFRSGPAWFRSRGFIAPARALFLAGALLVSGAAHGATNLFSTGFERSEGYDPAFELIGQNGWLTDSLSYGGNGLLTNWLGSQAAYIGLFPLEPADDYLALWKPVNYSPLPSGTPVVRFSVKMAIIDSSNTNRDDFYWSVYNRNGDSLLTIDFFNEDLGIYYSTDATNTLFYTGMDFTNDVPYTLTILMDFQQNKWTATLDGRTLVADKPITAKGLGLDLGDVDALWVPSNPSRPGNNYMVFDNYQVSAFIGANMPPTLTSPTKNANGQFGFSVEGALGARYAVEASPNLRQWTTLGTNTASNGIFNFTDPATASSPSMFYRLRLVP